MYTPFQHSCVCPQKLKNNLLKLIGNQVKNLRLLIITVRINECRGRLFTRAKATVGLFKIHP